MDKLTAIEKMKKRLVPGDVYRRNDFEDLTSNVDRNLVRLVEENLLKKVQNGLYLCPKNTPFGEALPEEEKLLEKLLNDKHFVVYSLNMFNSLGLGTTQLYNKKVVFNRKRHGEITLGSRTYHFHRWREAPKTLTKEFLLVEFVNRMNELAEDQEKLVKNLSKKLTEFNLKRLKNALSRFGTKSTQNKLTPLLIEAKNVSA